ncbi:hypothetical protein KAJ89_03555 [Candidatus Parcubacteria bacterium]|nr:hypothetical protein [Candidatus Parcubacteria bacterium]
MKKCLLIILSAAFFLLLFSSIAYAIDFKPQVTIDTEFTKGKTIPITPSTLGKYIKTIYTYAIGTVGILSTVVIIFGGFLWATAAGNNSRVDNAKTWITSALTGLVLALFSYTLLHMINPALVELTPINVTKIGTLEISCCDPNPTTGGPRNAVAIPNTNPIQYTCPTGTGTCTKDQTCKKSGGRYSCAITDCTNSRIGDACLTAFGSPGTCQLTDPDNAQLGGLDNDCEIFGCTCK